jgi:hypothetical protein
MPRVMMNFDFEEMANFERNLRARGAAANYCHLTDEQHQKLNE